MENLGLLMSSFSAPCPQADSSISMLGADEKPDVGYSDIGGMDMQKQEMREAVELPLSHFDLYKQIGEFQTSLIS